jgi:hypothetical protein
MSDFKEIKMKRFLVSTFLVSTLSTSIAMFVGAALLLFPEATVASKMQPGMMSHGAAHGLNANTTCRHPRINICQGCSIAIRMKVVQDHTCGFNFQSLGPFAGQEVTARPANGTYAAVNETLSRYQPSAGFVGRDHFTTRLYFEEGSGKKTFLNLDVNVFVVPSL